MISELCIQQNNGQIHIIELYFGMQFGLSAGQLFEFVSSVIVSKRLIFCNIYRELLFSVQYCELLYEISICYNHNKNKLARHGNQSCSLLNGLFVGMACDSIYETAIVHYGYVSIGRLRYVECVNWQNCQFGISTPEQHVRMNRADRIKIIELCMFDRQTCQKTVYAFLRYTYIITIAFIT